MDPEMADLNGGHVQILVRHDGTVMWVNYNGRCLVRVTKAETIDIEDYRPKSLPGG